MDDEENMYRVGSYIKDNYPEFYYFIALYFNPEYDVMFGKTLCDVVFSYFDDEKKETILECLKEMDDYIIWASDVNLSDEQFDLAFFQFYSYKKEFKNSTEWVKYLSYLMKKLYKG